MAALEVIFRSWRYYKAVGKKVGYEILQDKASRHGAMKNKKEKRKKKKKDEKK